MLHLRISSSPPIWVPISFRDWGRIFPYIVNASEKITLRSTLITKCLDTVTCCDILLQLFGTSDLWVIPAALYSERDRSVLGSVPWQKVSTRRIFQPKIWHVTWLWSIHWALTPGAFVASAPEPSSRGDQCIFWAERLCIGSSIWM